ncbi:hypothetical protein K431DRAFT_54629 [Polychaeton citri CBS 116435]|uniref:DUF2415 domain-containing protein n=1 Tax=Polychaeton citri CBS 116435 TaxID=1314669 RepID=A0A9P4QJ75_9PEZI|nr:hypothetical protein K431DRAFT_54629 [Polychaeton citri CBS 116435]
MAIDQIPYKEADHFARAQKSFYPVTIPVSHWQLRHYISNPEPDLLYYASGHDIYCLNTATRKRRHIITLPFEARCTASGYGWICVGGEDDERIGDEIVNSISIHRIQDESAHLDDIVAVLTNNDHTVRVYSLPQALETAVLDLPFPINHATVSPDGEMLVAVGDFNEAYFYSREIKGDVPQIPKPHNRLTSMNVEWVLTNVVGLHASSPELTSGYFTTAWSPNGKLCAIGSEGGYITIFDVDILVGPDLYDEDPIVMVVPSTRPDLPQPHPGAVRTLMFSPDPWDLLIWAEDQGRICIGDLRNGLKSRQVINLEPKDETLDKVECEVTPVDNGSIFADQRIPGDSESLHELEADFVRRNGPISDAVDAANFSNEYFAARRRQRLARQDAAQSRSSPDTLSSRRPGVLQDDVPQGFTSHEQLVLDALRTTRQRIEARTPPGQIPRSVNYTSSELFNHGVASNSNRSSAASTPNIGSSSARPTNDILSSVRDELPQLARTNATPPSRLDEGERDSNTLPPLRTHTGNADLPTTSSFSVRVAEGSRLPRRRASVMLSPPTSNPSSASTAAASNMPNAPIASATGRASTATTIADEVDDEENPWRTIEDAMHLARGPLFESAGRAPASISTLPGSSSNANTASSGLPTESALQAEVAAQRARNRSLAQQRERYRNRLLGEAQAQSSTATALRQELRRATELPAAFAGGFQEGYEALMRRQTRPGAGLVARFAGEVGTRTAGLAMSQDGRRLWAACEEGIFEIDMNLKSRMFWPGLDLR